MSDKRFAGDVLRLCNAVGYHFDETMRGEWPLYLRDSYEAVRSQIGLDIKNKLRPQTPTRIKEESQMPPTRKPCRCLLWYGVLTDWDGEQSLKTYDGFPIIGRYNEWENEGQIGSKGLVVVGYGECPRQFITLAEVHKRQCMSARLLQ